MKQVGVRVRALLLPAMLAPMLALPGCMASHFAPRSSALNSQYAGRGCQELPAGLAPAPARWWRCLGDAQLSALIEQALERAQAPPLISAQDNLTAAIASRYIALRAQQTALVLLAAREDIATQLVTMARQGVANGAALRQSLAAVAAQLADTRADQARTRGDIAALCDRLAILTGVAPDTLDNMPAGPIPLPPAAPVVAADPDSALGRYAAARLAASQAQSHAEQARIAAALQDMRARAAVVAPGTALAADRQAVDALQAEEQARAAMTEAYVALARPLLRAGGQPG